MGGDASLRGYAGAKSRPVDLHGLRLVEGVEKLPAASVVRCLLSLTASKEGESFVGLACIPRVS